MPSRFAVWPHEAYCAPVFFLSSSWLDFYRFSPICIQLNINRCRLSRLPWRPSEDNSGDHA